MRFLPFIIFLFAALAAPPAWSNDGFLKAMTAYKNGDYATAFQIFEPLAEQGDVDAQFYLGGMYMKGQGVIKNYKTSLKWYKRAAEQGDAKAQFNLGVIYMHPQAGIEDYTRAYMWASVAAENGHDIHRKLRNLIAKNMTYGQIEDAKKPARECIRKKYKGC